MTNVWVHDPSIPRDLEAIFDPFGNAVHTALQFPVLGEDVLVTGAGPIGIMAAAVARHAGARHVVVTDVNPYGWRSRNDSYHRQHRPQKQFAQGKPVAADDVARSDRRHQEQFEKAILFAVNIKTGGLGDQPKFESDAEGGCMSHTAMVKSGETPNSEGNHLNRSEAGRDGSI